MMREAFDIRKSFPGVPNVSYARWVGTIKHSTMAEGVKREQKRGTRAVAGWVQL